MENKRVTAIDWLAFILKSNYNMDIYHTTAFYSAKAMEKEQIEKAYESGCIGEVFELNCNHSSEQYYNETYGK